MVKAVPYFQPIVSPATACVAGHEVLARFELENGEIASPAQFLFNNAYPLEQRIAWDRELRERALQYFKAQGEPGYLTINIQPEWINSHQAEQYPTIQAINRIGVDPRKIVIEIVETAADKDKLKAAIRAYRKEGYSIAIDDFGANNSNFDRVFELEPDIVKLDMGLFQQALKDGGQAESLIESICYLSQRLGCKLVAEGIESFDDFTYSQRLSTDLIQGYLFSSALKSFTPQHNFNEQILNLRQEYIQKQTAQLKKRQVRRQVIEMQIREALQPIQELNTLLDEAMRKLAHPDFFQILLCDDTGHQVTNSAFYKNGRWISSPEQSHDWQGSHYFCELMSKLALQPEGLHTSTPYHHKQAKQMVETIAMRINESNTLFIDVLQD